VLLYKSGSPTKAGHSTPTLAHTYSSLVLLRMPSCTDQCTREGYGGHGWRGEQLVGPGLRVTLGGTPETGALKAAGMSPNSGQDKVHTHQPCLGPPCRARLSHLFR